MREISRILVFDLKGHLAHFRKFYTNSSALTYSFPPYTTISGLLAGILGRERDTYYREFSSNNSQIAVSINNEGRKIMQTINYIRTKSKKEYDGSAGPTPTPVELLLGKEGKVSFRIYFNHKDESIMDEVKERIQKQRYVYPPYLGISEFTGELEYVDDLRKGELELITPGSGEVAKIRSAINTDFIQDKGIVFSEAEDKLRIYKEKMPLEFDENRYLKDVASFIFDIGGGSIPVLLKTPYYKLKLGQSEENIVFLNQQG